MRKHWIEDHPEKLAKIQAWLGDTDKKIMTAQILASEGMRGPGENGRVGGLYSPTLTTPGAKSIRDLMKGDYNDS